MRALNSLTEISRMVTEFMFLKQAVIQEDNDARNYGSECINGV
jgi:hypothetical protein